MSLLGQEADQGLPGVGSDWEESRGTALVMEVLCCDGGVVARVRGFAQGHLTITL